MRAKPNKCNPSTVIKYIGRYLGRPIIATKRIDSYDGSNVTFHFLLSFTQWHTSILTTFGYDPLKCPKCGNSMFFLELYHKKQHIPLDEVYEKVM